MMSDVLDKVKWELEGDKVGFDITEEEVVEAISFLVDMTEFFEGKGHNVNIFHNAIKGMAMLWAMLFGEKTEVKVDD